MGYPSFLHFSALQSIRTLPFSNLRWRVLVHVRLYYCFVGCLSTIPRILYVLRWSRIHDQFVCVLVLAVIRWPHHLVDVVTGICDTLLVGRLVIGQYTTPSEES